MVTEADKVVYVQVWQTIAPPSTRRPNLHIATQIVALFTF